MPEEQTPPQQPTAPNAAEVQQAIDQVAQQAAFADPKVPIEIKLKTGQVYKGLPHEVISTLTHSQEEASETIRRMKDDQTRLQGELEQLRQAQATPPAKDGEYEPSKYYELFQKDPLEASKYLDRFDPEKQEIQQTLQSMRVRNDLQRFQDAVGFYPNEQEKATFADEFVKSKLDPTPTNYEVVYWRLRAQNKLAGVPLSGIEGSQAPPPILRSSGSSGPQIFDVGQFESLPADQQAAVIQRLKAQGWK